MLNPFDWRGTEFLILYAIALAAAIAAGMALPAWLRPAGRDTPMRDVDALAYLAGGRRRFVDTVLARLLARDALTIEGRTLVGRSSDAGGGAAERAVLGLAGPVRASAVDRVLGGEIERVDKRLVADGLMIDETAARRLRWRQTAPYLLLLAFGATKWTVGVGRDRPVGFLSALLLLTAVLAWLRWRDVDRRTRAGERLLRAEQARADRLRRAPTATETDEAVALFGTVVLAGSAYEPLHRMRQPSSNDGGGGSVDGGGDGGDGGGGCGGGGCGGCGS